MYIRPGCRVAIIKDNGGGEAIKPGAAVVSYEPEYVILTNIGTPNFG